MEKTEINVENILFDKNLYTIQNNELISREQSLQPLLDSKNKYSTYIIVGVGGIGSWVSYFCSRISTCDKIVMFDPDIVEITNLNRTPFREFDVGSLKVDALSGIIAECAFKKKIIPINKRFLHGRTCEFIESNKNLKKLLKTSKPGRTCLIDCRDNEFDDFEEITELSKLIGRIDVIRVAYDGFSVTLDLDPENNKSWGEGSGYSVDPSHVLPSSFAGLLSVLASFDYDELKKREISKRHLTFNIFNIINFLYIGSLVSAKTNQEITSEDILKIVFKGKKR